MYVLLKLEKWTPLLHQKVARTKPPMSMKQTIFEKLSKEFAPTHLNVIDESELHRGHAGYREGGNSHFRVQIAAAALDGKTRVAQQRAVMDCMAQELKEAIHAFAIEVSPSDKFRP